MNRIIPTEIRQNSLVKFKELYFKKYDYLLSDKQSEEEAFRLLRLVILLAENYEKD